jgi:hypothetical protein
MTDIRTLEQQKEEFKQKKLLASPVAAYQELKKDNTLN